MLGEELFGWYPCLRVGRKHSYNFEFLQLEESPKLGVRVEVRLVFRVLGVKRGRDKKESCKQLLYLLLLV